MTTTYVQRFAAALEFITEDWPRYRINWSLTTC